MVAILFPSSINHSTIAQACLANGVEGVEGAGFFKVCDGQVEVYGRSQSLSVESRPVDAKLVYRTLGLTPPD